MGGPGSVTVWLERLKTGGNGDRNEIVSQLWGRYFSLLVKSAHGHLQGRTRKEGAEDVALVAFASFVRAAEAGRFPKLNDRNDLWQILLSLAARKASNAARDERRAKRGGGRVVHASAAADPDASGIPVPSAEPDPAEAVALAEGAARLLAALDDPQLEQIAVWALQGYENAEIAVRIGKSVATVERKLKRIRMIWTNIREGG